MNGSSDVTGATATDPPATDPPATGLSGARAPDASELGRSIEDVRRTALLTLSALGSLPRALRLRAGAVTLELEWQPEAPAPAPATTNGGTGNGGAAGGAVPAPAVSNGGAVPAPALTSGAGAGAAEPQPPGSAPHEAGITACAPTVGVFYRCPQPGAPPFVSVGDAVVGGQQLGIVEAMKLMIPVTAPAAGTVAAVLRSDGDPVEYGETLFTLSTRTG